MRAWPRRGGGGGAEGLSTFYGTHLLEDEEEEEDEEDEELDEASSLSSLSSAALSLPFSSPLATSLLQYRTPQSGNRTVYSKLTVANGQQLPGVSS